MKQLLVILFIIPLVGFSQTNLDLPASTSSAGQIRIGGKTVLHTYGLNNYFAAGAGNFVMQQQGTYNVAIGLEALQKNLIGDYNTAIGHYAGKMNRYGRRNIFLGYNAGNNSVFADLSDRLIIDNTTTSTPFIYGNMATGVRLLTINGSLTVTSQVKFPGLTQEDYPYVLVYDTLTGRVYYGLNTSDNLWEIDTIGTDGDYSYLDYSSDYSLSTLAYVIVNTGSYDVQTTGDLNVEGELTEKDVSVSRWRGTSSSDPPADIQEGDLYFNSNDSKVYIRANSSWQALN